MKIPLPSSQPNMAYYNFIVGVTSDGEPFYVPIGGTGELDQQMFPGPVSKEQLEDLQLCSILESMSLYDGARHPLSARPGNDPPDRVITFGDREWATELTEL